jgi:hypothetical protein
VDDEVASIALDQVPAGQRIGADPALQNEPATQDTQKSIKERPDKECDFPAGHGLGRIDSKPQK